jgi:hypothetical protein
VVPQIPGSRLRRDRAKRDRVCGCSITAALGVMEAAAQLVQLVSERVQFRPVVVV